MTLALKGLPSRHIGKELAISHQPVERRSSRLLEKPGVASIASLRCLILDRPLP